MKKIVLFVCICIFSFFIQFDKAVAATGKTWSQGSSVTVWTSIDGVNDYKRWTEGVLMVDNAMVYCVELGKYFKPNLILSSNDPVEFFQKRANISKKESQELVTRLALYHDYLTNRGDLNLEQIHFFGQVLMWTAVDDYMNWPAEVFWIDAWGESNIHLFPCKNPDFDVCGNENTKYEQDIYAGAEKYYQENKKKFRGTGIVWDNGVNQPLIQLETERIDYDYTVDSTCVNCNSYNSDNVAYVIKDTSDWDAILNSSDSDNKNVQGYYNNGSGNVYCREEYTVYFPNARNQIYVDPGKFFTLNPSSNSWNGLYNTVLSTSAIPVLKPIKVMKKKECQANVELTQGEKESDEAFAQRVHNAKMSALRSYESSNKSSFRKNMGTVWFRYNETYNGKYNMTEPETLDDYDNTYNSSLNSSSETLTMESYSSYELPEDYYQYIRLRDGLSMKKKPTDDVTTHYKNVGIENLPISFQNYGDENSKAADIQFAYDLPTSGTKISQAASDSNYLKTDEAGDNIYKQYLSGNFDDDVKKQLENSACAQMYGYGTSGFRTCASERVNNKTGSNGGNCISKSSIMGSTTSGYSCMVLTNINEDDCSSEEDANRLGVTWNPITQVCCPAGTKYNPELGKCSPNDKTCRIEHGKYYDFNGNEISKEQYDKICGSDTPTCPEDECPYGCCPSGECAPMPDGTCPGLGGIDVIYRTIDLEDPFPGQNAENRNTGANWCSYNIKTQTIDCKYNNQTVKNYVTRERNNIKNGNKVYDENHILYEVTLDSQSIQRIRDYNDDNKYDDWKLTCKDNGKACISEFLNEVVDVSGLCDDVNKDSFYTCDKDV